MDKNRLFLATFSKDALKLIKEHGIGIEFNHFCISKSLDEGIFDRTVSIMKRNLADLGIGTDKAICHGPFTEITPMAIDHTFVEAARTRLEQAYRGCREIGVNRMVVHTGLIPDLYYPEWHVKQSSAFWKSFMDDKPEEFHLYIENVLDPDPEPLRDIIDKIDDPRVRVCLDIGHANAAGRVNRGGTVKPWNAETDPSRNVSDGTEVYSWIRTLGPRIRHFHFHNNDGSYDAHHEVMEGTMDIPEVLSLIRKECGEDFTVTIESHEAFESIPYLLGL